MRLRVKVADRWYDVEVGAWEGDRVQALVDGEPVMVRLEDVVTTAPTAAAEAEVVSESADDAGDNAIRSPLPGVVLSIDVGVGDQVSAGGRVCMLEAMKMEQELVAPRDGRVKAVRVQKGDSVLIGQTIVELE